MGFFIFSLAAAVASVQSKTDSAVATAAVAPPKAAKLSARPKFDLQASLQKPMSWKNTAAVSSVVATTSAPLKDKTNTIAPKTATAKPVIEAVSKKPNDSRKSIVPTPAIENAHITGNNKRKSVLPSAAPSVGVENDTHSSNKRKSVATGESAEERRKRYSESLRRMSVVHAGK